jgi:hypothetical protein
MTSKKERREYCRGQSSRYFMVIFVYSAPVSFQCKSGYSCTRTEKEMNIGKIL